MKTLAFLALAFIALTPSAATAGGPTRVAAAADALVAAGVPGVVVYTRHGAQTSVVARGVDDLATRRHMQPGDAFRVGSVTKSFVATVLMQLVDEGKLSLSDTVDQHLPGLVTGGKAITYRQLLSHTSGLPDYFSNARIFAPYASGNLTHVSSPEQIVRISSTDKRLFAPGANGRFAYSNTGYYVIGLTIEKITGRTLATEIARRIVRPLGLRHTSLPTANVMPGRYAHGYTNDFGKHGQDTSVLSPTILWAAGGVVSTATDVATFYRALFRGRLLPLRLVRQMQTAQVVIPQSHGRQAIGLGLFRVQLPCGVSWGHNGDLPGYTTQAYSSADGSRQAVLEINAGEEGSFTPAQEEALGKLTLAAFCG